MDSLELVILMPSAGLVSVHHHNQLKFEDKINFFFFLLHTQNPEVILYNDLTTSVISW